MMLPFSTLRPFTLIWPASAQPCAKVRLLAIRRKNSSLSIRTAVAVIASYSFSPLSAANCRASADGGDAGLGGDGARSGLFFVFAGLCDFGRSG